MSADFKQGANLAALILYANQLGTAVSVLYTVPASSAVKVGSASCTNVSGTSADLTVYLVPSGSAANSNMIISSYPIVPGSTVIIDSLIGAFLPAGASIQAFSSLATSLSMSITGVLSS